MNNFKFKPRIQRLNELEANSRIKLNFLDKLSKFHELQGNKFKIPIVEKRPLDLYQLYKAVEKMGGYENLVTNKLWSQLIRQLDFKEATSARNVKIQYEKLLYPYLLFEADVTLPLNKTNKNDDSAIADDDDNDDDEDDEDDDDNYYDTEYIIDNNIEINSTNRSMKSNFSSSLNGTRVKHVKKF